MKKLVLLRHSQSLWNLENKFTGWTDVDLCDQGIQEAHKVGQVLKAEGYTFNVAYTSVLKRSVRTLWIALDEMDLMWIPVYRSWRLNELHYGALQGLNKKATVEKHGALQVHIWRRSYAIQPPALTLTDPRHPRFDQRYVHLKEEEMPCTESLKDTLSRVLPYWNKVIVPRLKEGKLILISAHGNSLRALVKYLDNISNDDIMELNVPTGVPLVYEFDDELKVRTHYYIGSEKEIKT